ncbi:MAG TPA: ABC transporter permease, partial [Rhodothermales bacterium]|nr:ABC transporter permease [Rhodothermales bacterium]
MLKNYLTIALRNLRKHKGYASINVIGLSLGIAAATLIFLFARNELTFDRFHEHADDTYFVYKVRHAATGAQETYDTWVPLVNRLKTDFPSIVNGTQVSTNGAWVQHGEERFQEMVTYTDTSLFEIFSFPLAQGDGANPLPHNNAAVISEDIAHTYFGEADPIGQVLTIDFQVDYTITGVLAEMPPNSTLQFDILVPMTSSPDYADFENNWGQSFLGTYIQLEDEAAAANLEAQFPTLITDIWDADVASRTDFKLLPLRDVNDTLTGNRQYAYILLAIALATILIACINFINLATARSVDRAREIGVRKVLGAERRQLVRQLLSESVLMGLLALVIGVALAQVLLPIFNDLYETTLRLRLLQEPQMLLGLIGVGLTVGLLAGSYPALFLSRFEPIKSLRGTSTMRPGGLRLRHGLVVVQFALSIFLIAGTGVMWNQVRYMKTQNVGFDKENIVVLTVDTDDFADPEEAAVHLQTFKDQLARLPEVQGVASSSRVPGNGFGSFTFARPEGGDPDQPLRLRWVAVDEYFFDTFNIPFAEGRNFIPGSEADRNEALIINEAALRDFGWTDTANKIVRVGRTDFQVIGVVADYNYASLQETV